MRVATTTNTASTVTTSTATTTASEIADPSQPTALHAIRAPGLVRSQDRKFSDHGTLVSLAVLVYTSTGVFSLVQMLRSEAYQRLQENDPIVRQAVEAIGTLDVLNRWSVENNESDVCAAAIKILMDLDQAPLLVQLVGVRLGHFEFPIGHSVERAMMVAALDQDWPSKATATLSLSTALQPAAVAMLQVFARRPATLHLHINGEKAPSQETSFAPDAEFTHAWDRLLQQKKFGMLQLSGEHMPIELLQVLAHVKTEAIHIKLPAPTDATDATAFNDALQLVAKHADAQSLDLGGATIGGQQCARMIASRPAWGSLKVCLTPPVLQVLGGGKHKVNVLTLLPEGPLLDVGEAFLQMLHEARVQKLGLAEINLVQWVEQIETHARTHGNVPWPEKVIVQSFIVPPGTDINETLNALRKDSTVLSLRHLALPTHIDGYEPLDETSAQALQQILDAKEQAARTATAMAVTPHAQDQAAATNDIWKMNAARTITPHLGDGTTVGQLLEHLRVPESHWKVSADIDLSLFHHLRDSRQLALKLMLMEKIQVPTDAVGFAIALQVNSDRTLTATAARQAWIEAQLQRPNRTLHAWLDLGAQGLEQWRKTEAKGVHSGAAPAPNPVERPTAALVSPGTTQGVQDLAQRLRARVTLHENFQANVDASATSTLVDWVEADFAVNPSGTPEERAVMARELLDQGQGALLRHWVPEHATWELTVGTATAAAEFRNMQDWPQTGCKLVLDVKPGLALPDVATVLAYALRVPSSSLTLRLDAGPNVSVAFLNVIASTVRRKPGISLELTQSTPKPSEQNHIGTFLQAIAGTSVHSIRLHRLNQWSSPLSSLIQQVARQSRIPVLLLSDCEANFANKILKCNTWKEVHVDASTNTTLAFSGGIQVPALTLTMPAHSGRATSEDAGFIIGASKGLKTLDVRGQINALDVARSLGRSPWVHAFRCEGWTYSDEELQQAQQFFRQNKALTSFQVGTLASTDDRLAQFVQQVVLDNRYRAIQVLAPGLNPHTDFKTFSETLAPWIAQQPGLQLPTTWTTFSRNLLLTKVSWLSSAHVQDAVLSELLASSLEQWVHTARGPADETADAIDQHLEALAHLDASTPEWWLTACAGIPAPR